MDLRQLEYFVTVVDEGGFGRAAARLFAAQSTVSAGVRALERDISKICRKVVKGLQLACSSGTPIGSR
ncbi:LysR family transcriptional regulator [Microbacterium sp. SCN 71-21]|uniref:LysR family transcriptional regulator n=1 Tax=Microbacterium sp. SCN 71-21 TaxID=1660116 RepID=UPI000AA87C2E|nr:LysR family transcriptional regulator [Microbacterium sp. SCN 71-21]